MSLIQCQTAIPFLRYDFFQIWPWKSKGKFMIAVKVESHKVGVTSYRLTSLSYHVNRPSHSWDTAFSKFDLENPRSRSWVRWTLKVTTWVQHSIDSHPFHSMSISPSIPEIQHFQNLTLKIQRQGQMIMILHNYRSRQFHRIEISVPQSLAQVLPDLTSFWPMGKPIWGKWANNYKVAQLQV